LIRCSQERPGSERSRPQCPANRESPKGLLWGDQAKRRIWKKKGQSKGTLKILIEKGDLEIRGGVNTKEALKRVAEPGRDSSGEHTAELMREMFVER